MQRETSVSLPRDSAASFCPTKTYLATLPLRLRYGTHFSYAMTLFWLCTYAPPMRSIDCILLMLIFALYFFLALNFWCELLLTFPAFATIPRLSPRPVATGFLEGPLRSLSPACAAKSQVAYLLPGSNAMAMSLLFLGCFLLRVFPVSCLCFLDHIIGFLSQPGNP